MVLLKMINITKLFGGLKAVDSMTLEVEEGNIVGLIGPNGAGKTTIFNLITSFLRPSQGNIIFNGRSLLDLKPHVVCKLGISRTFQLVKAFGNLTVLENVMVGAFHTTKNPNHAKLEALKVLDFLKLTHLRNARADSITISSRKHLEIARALATKPRLLMLDEPMGGMNPAEIDGMTKQLQRIRETGVTLFIIEHIMKAIMTISDQIIVINQGKKLAQGTPKEISMNQDVITAYLGEEQVVS